MAHRMVAVVGLLDIMSYFSWTLSPRSDVTSLRGQHLSVKYFDSSSIVLYSLWSNIYIYNCTKYLQLAYQTSIGASKTSIRKCDSADVSSNAERSQLWNIDIIGTHHNVHFEVHFCTPDLALFCSVLIATRGRHLAYKYDGLNTNRHSTYPRPTCNYFFFLSPCERAAHVF